MHIYIYTYIDVYIMHIHYTHYTYTLYIYVTIRIYIYMYIYITYTYIHYIIRSMNTHSNRVAFRLEPIPDGFHGYHASAFGEQVNRWCHTPIDGEDHIERDIQVAWFGCADSHGDSQQMLRPSPAEPVVRWLK